MISRIACWAWVRSPTEAAASCEVPGSVRRALARVRRMTSAIFTGSLFFGGIRRGLSQISVPLRWYSTQTLRSQYTPGLSGCSAPQTLRSAILAVLGDLDVDPDGCLPGPPLVGVQVLPEFLDLLVGLPQQGDQAVQGAGVRGALLLARALLGGLPQLPQLLEQPGQGVAHLGDQHAVRLIGPVRHEDLALLRRLDDLVVERLRGDLELSAALLRRPAPGAVQPVVVLVLVEPPRGCGGPLVQILQLGQLLLRQRPVGRGVQFVTHGSPGLP